VLIQVHSKWLAGLLLVSLLANIVFAVRLQSPFAWQQLRLAMIPTPQLSAADHILGPADAATTVIVYTNYQCPYCARLNADLITLGSELDFRLVYRHFAEPTQEAFQAAAAAECAGDQGRFWEYSDILFNSTPQTLNDERLQQIAEQLQLDMSGFAECTRGEKYKDPLLAARQQAAEDQKINATPTYFINGKRHIGLKPYTELKRLVMAVRTNS
jgi:protein-disulfide isomerase